MRKLKNNFFVYSILLCLLVPLSPVSLSGARLMLEAGLHQDYLKFDGQSYSATHFPSFGISLAATDPGFNPRFKGTLGYRDFKLNSTRDSSSTIKLLLGAEYIFKAFNSFCPYVFTGIQYRFSEEKYLYAQSGSYYYYDYEQFKNISLPLITGFFYSLTPSVLISSELEFDLISFYSTHKKMVDLPSRPYKEYSLALYAAAGLLF